MEAYEGKAATGDVEGMVRRLMGIMEREIEGASPAPEDSGTDSITRLNLDSLALIGFLVAVEEELDVEWDSNADHDVLRSFDAMARYVLTQRPGAA